MFSGGNQLGKTYSLCIKIACHLTGLYLPGWTGVKFDHPPEMAILGETAHTVRDLLVNDLLGEPEDRGSGIIPPHCFDPEADITKMTGGIPHQVDYFRVKHYTDGVFDGYSKCSCFAYSKGWKKIQGYTLDYIALDEEPPMEVFSECLARFNATEGYIDISLSPLSGETPLYQMFAEKDDFKLINYGILDATWMPESTREKNLNDWEGHYQASARLYGIPVAGEGAIYPYPDSWLLMEEEIEIPDSFEKIIGLDFPHTTGHFAAVLLAWDRESDIIYIVNTYKAKGLERPTYADAVKRMGGAEVPCAWPHDAGRVLGGSAGSGTIMRAYKDLGLNMLPLAAHTVDNQGRKSHRIQPAIEDLCDRMATGRLKVLPRCRDWLKEKSQYRAEDGKILPKQDDHLLDATHKAIMMISKAKKQTEVEMLDLQRIHAQSFDFYTL